MKKYLGKIITGVAILLGVVAIIMLAAPGITIKPEYQVREAESFSMANLTFGKDVWAKNLGLGFSFPNFLTFILVVVGIVCSIVSICGKGGKVLPIIAAVALVAAGVLFFCVQQMYTIKLPKDFTGELKQEAVKFYKKQLDTAFTLGAGAIVGGVLSILAGAAALVPMFIKSK
ncbi:MAG: hypothetical protein K2K60_03850 [Clostridia bacterium]|nr:hypothetical protein [Clostridia bacterium]